MKCDKRTQHTVRVQWECQCRKHNTPSPILSGRGNYIGLMFSGTYKYVTGLTCGQEVGLIFSSEAMNCYYFSVSLGQYSSIAADRRRVGSYWSYYINSSWYSDTQTGRRKTERYERLSGDDSLPSVGLNPAAVARWPMMALLLATKLFPRHHILASSITWQYGGRRPQ